MEKNNREITKNNNLRKGWTTGACATAAAKSAYYAMVTGNFLNPIQIFLPNNKSPKFRLHDSKINKNYAYAAIEKDAGDDPDVTHGAIIEATVTENIQPGITFKAGEGVGTVTKSGLPLNVGEPAINPKPREMIHKELAEIAKQSNKKLAITVTIGVKNGKALANKTWNPRLGIVNGLSILGTTGVVIPYSCSAWIHSIHRGVDVAVSNNIKHIGAAIGNTSEQLLQKQYNLPLGDIIDMGDFVGGMLKYLAKNPVANVTIAGGFAKLCKLAKGETNLHSKYSRVDMNFLKNLAISALKQSNENNLDNISKIKNNNFNTALEFYNIVAPLVPNLGDKIADQCLCTVTQIIEKYQPDNLPTKNINLEILVSNRNSSLIGKSRSKNFSAKTKYAN